MRITSSASHTATGATRTATGATRPKNFQRLEPGRTVLFEAALAPFDYPTLRFNIGRGLLDRKDKLATYVRVA